MNYIVRDFIYGGEDVCNLWPKSPFLLSPMWPLGKTILFSFYSLAFLDSTQTSWNVEYLVFPYFFWDNSLLSLSVCSGVYCLVSTSYRFSSFPHFTSIFIPLWAEKITWYDFNYLILLRPVFCPIIWSSLENVPCVFRRIYILLLLDRLFYRYLLGPFDLLFGSSHPFLVHFPSGWFMYCWHWGTEVPYYCCIVYFSPHMY